MSTDQSHPLRVFKAAQEAHVGVRGRGARHAGLHQLLKAVLHLSHVTNLDGNHLPLLERVLLPSLNTMKSVISQVSLPSIALNPEGCSIFL